MPLCVVLSVYLIWPSNQPMVQCNCFLLSFFFLRNASLLLIRPILVFTLKSFFSVLGNWSPFIVQVYAMFTVLKNKIKYKSVSYNANLCHVMSNTSLLKSCYKLATLCCWPVSRTERISFKHQLLLKLNQASLFKVHFKFSRFLFSMNYQIGRL